MNGWIRCGALALSCLMPVAAWAQSDGSAMGLVAAYEAALANDPEFRMARAARDEGAENEAIGRSRILPTVSGLASYNQNDARIQEASGVVDDRGRYASSATNLQLRQPLYDRDAWVQREQGMVRTAGSEAQFRAREQELIVRVFDAYVKALLAQDEVLLVRATLDAVGGQMRANEQRLRNGEGTRTEVLETRSRLTLLEAQLVEAQDSARSALAALQAIVGVPVQSLQRIRPAGARAPVDAGIAQWREQALAVNGEIESLRQSVEDARLEVRRIGSGHLPRLALLVSVGTNDSDTTATYRQNSQTATVGLQLNIPIYAGGSVSAQERQAAARLALTQAELDTRIAKLDVELQRQYDAQRSGVRRIDALRAAVRNGNELVDATRRSFIGGERTNVDVLDAQESLARTERDLLEARYQQMLAGLRLRQLAGVLAEEDLRKLAVEFGAAV